MKAKSRRGVPILPACGSRVVQAFRRSKARPKLSTKLQAPNPKQVPSFKLKTPKAGARPLEFRVWGFLGILVLEFAVPPRPDRGNIISRLTGLLELDLVRSGCSRQRFVNCADERTHDREANQIGGKPH